MRYILAILILFFIGCGSSTTKEDKPLGEESNTSNITEDNRSIIVPTENNTTIDNNSSDKNGSSEIETTLTPTPTPTLTPSPTPTPTPTIAPTISKMGKAQLGVMAEAEVKIYELNGTKRVLIATEYTSKGTTIDTIGNFNLNLAKLNGSKFYIYEVSGGLDWDVEDDGVINVTPTPNKGTFHLIAKGDAILNIDKFTITILSEVVYQKVLPYINSDKMEERLDASSKEVIKTDINKDGNIDLKDILNYDPVKDRPKVISSYQAKIGIMITNILSGRDFDYQEEDNSSTYPQTEGGIQQALDGGDYDYVISQLNNNRDAYSDLNDDEVNMNIAGAYVGKSGYTVFDITSAISNSSSSLNGFISDVTKDNSAVDAINELKRAEEYYSSVVSDINCSNTDGLTQEQKSSCFNLGLVKLTSLSNSVKLLFGGDKDVVTKWASGVDKNSSDDLNGNGVIDSSDASACAIVYANNPNDDCRDGSMATYRKRVTFINSSGDSYNITLIDVDVGSPKLKFKTFNRLITNKSSNNSAILTDGICDLNFNKSSNSVDGITYFPCPVVNNGALMNISDSLVGASNIQSLFPDDSDTKTTTENYIKNITGSKDGVIDQNNLASYLQSH
jgi:hypothetical protein